MKLIEEMIEATNTSDNKRAQEIEAILLEMPIPQAEAILIEFKENDSVKYFEFAKLTPNKEIYKKIIASFNSERTA